MAVETIDITLPSHLVREIDRHIAGSTAERIAYVQQAVANQLRIESAVAAILDKSNAKGRALGFQSEEQVLRQIDNE